MVLKSIEPNQMMSYHRWGDDSLDDNDDDSDNHDSDND